MNAAISSDPSGKTAVFHVSDYDLAGTLTSGQAFRWQQDSEGRWVGVIRNRWVRLTSEAGVICAETAETVSDWNWLADYLQVDIDLSLVLATFPDDEPMRAAVDACRGLRLLRQDFWECLASFILSSSKQIVQIQQIVRILCARYGDVIPAPEGFGEVHGFPAPERIARCCESDLRECRMGYRAPYLLETARRVAGGEVNVERLCGMSLEQAREALMGLPGVGRKIADCVLLFALGFQRAFPVDVWVMKALQRLYFSNRRVGPKRLRRFSETHFGANSGYAQQYLFHYTRTKLPRSAWKARGGARAVKGRTS